MADAAVVFSPATPVATHRDVKAKLGLNSFSTPPTIAEINASSDWYQIVGLLNRRMWQLYDSPTYFVLDVDAQNRPKPASVNSLRDTINDFRNAMQLADYNFGSTLISGMPTNGLHLTDLRTALNIGATTRRISTRSQMHIRVDHPYGTQTSQSNAVDVAAGSGGSTFKIGNIGVGSDVHRDRLPFTLTRAQSLNAGVTIKFTFQLFSGVSGTGELYMSNTDDSALPSGYENNLNTLCASNTMVFGTAYDFVVPISDFNARSSLSNISLLLVEATERANTNSNLLSLLAGTFTMDGGW